MTNDDAFMALAGVRYCLGRHSYAPGLCCDCLRRKWASFDSRDQQQIVKEIDQHIAQIESRDDWIAPGWEDDFRAWRSFSAWAGALGATRQRGGADA